MSNQPKKNADEPSFERAMERLETIVDEMESGKLMLEDVIVRYEEGMKLVGVCQERLANAEKRIEIITRNHAGKPVIKPFEPEEPPAPPKQQTGKTNDEVRLF